MFLGYLLAAACSGVLAGEAPPAVADPALEKHVMAISEELRCLVCQNQTIADSHAELAVDLRNQVREQIQQGKSDQDVLDYMVQRYGDFVLYRPPVKGSTWLLWFGPFLLLGAGALALLLRLRRRRAPLDALPQGEMERAAHLLDATTELKETR
ncbi:MAG: cytochrome c-type biogenesis protein [Telluria sp.]